MTERQKRFCEEYLIDLNATQAAIRAGYSKKGAGVTASKMLTNTNVKAYIQERMEEMRSEKTASAAEVMEYLTSVMRGESRSEVVVVEGTGDGCSAASCIEKAPDEKERLKAAELMGKRWGIFTDKVNVDAAAKVVIVDDVDAES